VPKPLPLRSVGVPGYPTPAFWEKRLQVIDSKERERGKERKEAARV